MYNCRFYILFLFVNFFGFFIYYEIYILKFWLNEYLLNSYVILISIFKFYDFYFFLKNGLYFLIISI